MTGPSLCLRHCRFLHRLVSCRRDLGCVVLATRCRLLYFLTHDTDLLRGLNAQTDAVSVYTQDRDLGNAVADNDALSKPTGEH